MGRPWLSRHCSPRWTEGALLRCSEIRVQPCDCGGVRLVEWFARLSKQESAWIFKSIYLPELSCLSGCDVWMQRWWQEVLLQSDQRMGCSNGLGHAKLRSFVEVSLGGRQTFHKHHCLSRALAMAISAHRSFRMRTHLYDAHRFS